MTEFYAHTAPGDCSNWEPLFTPECTALSGGVCAACENLERFHGHLNKVGWWTAKFAETMFSERDQNARASARDWGYVAGLWHDLGKFAEQWQAYLRTRSDIHQDEVAERTDHATAGAQHAVARSEILGHLFAFAIAGHHSGLLDTLSDGACLEKRLEKDVAPYQDAPVAILDWRVPQLPAIIAERLRQPIVPALFTRLLFSALVDADFLATESFMNSAQTAMRPKHDPELLVRMLAALESFVERFPVPATDVDRARSAVYQACLAAGRNTPGLFSLTVPTGGGKTLSSLAFALRHAITHGQQRVIYVIPFTSIIEQNAAVFRSAFASLQQGRNTPVILEHHSNLDAEEWETSRITAENWDAPLIVTTAVQFYESLHASRTSSSRKLHNIANSVVILDEAQSLPVEYLRPCLDVLRELSSRYNTTVVLCTATQPAVQRTADFTIGLEGLREIAPDPARLYQTLRRVNIVDRGKLGDATLAKEIAALPQVLVILNTRRHAQALFRLLPESAGNFHLSALMCPAHRAAVLAEVRQRLSVNEPTRLIATQVVEAGVDIDFPRGYRALAGIDSIAQAAGRCNRNGRWAGSELHLFRSEHQRSEAYFRETAQAAERVLACQGDPLSLASVEQFFNLYYLQHQCADGPRWDKKDICGSYRLTNDRELPFIFQFKRIAETFRLIESDQMAVLIPYDERARSLVDELRNDAIPLYRNLLRNLQRYTVQIYRRDFLANRAQFESLRDDQFHALICPETQYSSRFGLVLDTPNDTPLIC